MAPMWPHMCATSKDPASSKIVGKVKLDIPPNPDRVATAYSWGFCAASGSKKSRCGHRVGQVVDVDRASCRLRQDLAEPGAARIVHRDGQVRYLDQRRGQGGDRDLCALGRQVEDY